MFYVCSIRKQTGIGFISFMGRMILSENIPAPACRTEYKKLWNVIFQDISGICLPGPLLRQGLPVLIFIYAPEPAGILPGIDVIQGAEPAGHQEDYDYSCDSYEKDKHLHVFTYIHDFSPG